MSSQRDSTDARPKADAEPRALTRATGLIFQVVGVVLTLGGCCFWSFSGIAQSKQPIEAARTIVDVWRAGGAEPIWAMGGVCVTFVGGLALAACGLGLQAERPRAGRIATIVAAAGAIFWLACGAWTLAAEFAWGRCLLAALMALLWCVCFVLGLVSADELRRCPPPDDLGVAPPDLRLDRVTDREMPSDLREPPRADR
ncbi:MAG: hypothetical protein L6Q92_14540 [Phycisphaerae bacterium]|nr:hypothetical protein [Phycisphaerae bacterium]